MWGTTHRIYLDWAAAAPVSERARGVFLAALEASGNPSSPHEEGRAAKRVLEDARTRIARLAEVKPEGVLFTGGATEANALAILGSVRARGVAGAHVLYQESQHASVIGAVEMLKEEGAVTEAYTFDDLASKLRAETVLVTVDAVNSETGERFDTLSIRRRLDAHHSGVLLHVDAAQLPLSGSFLLAQVGADLLTLDAQKVGGIRGIGVLLARPHIPLAPLMRGGGQERGRRPGTESPALAAACAAALLECTEKRDRFTAEAGAMRRVLLSKLSRIPDCEINEGKEKVPHIVNVSLMGRDTDYLVALLDAKGYAVSTRSACESDAQGSRAVLALTGDVARAAATLRISWGHATRRKDLEAFADALESAVRFLDENAI